MEKAPTPDTSNNGIVYELNPKKDMSWDMILDATYRDGAATFTFEGKTYTITIGDLLEHEQSAIIEV